MKGERQVNLKRAAYWPVEIELKSWIAKKLGSDTRFVEGVVKATTNKAVLIATDDGDEFWIPYAGIELLCFTR